MTALKTGDTVQWLKHKPKGAFWEHGTIIGWYAHNAPIILLPSPDPEGNTAFVCVDYVLTKAPIQSANIDIIEW